MNIYVQESMVVLFNYNEKFQGHFIRPIKHTRDLLLAFKTSNV